VADHNQSDQSQIQLAFNIEQVKARSTIQIAPTRGLTVVQRDSQTVLEAMRCLIPVWAKDLRIGARLINARAESWRETELQAAAQSQRCLIVADVSMNGPGGLQKIRCSFA